MIELKLESPVLRLIINKPFKSIVIPESYTDGMATMRIEREGLRTVFHPLGKACGPTKIKTLDQNPETMEG